MCTRGRAAVLAALVSASTVQAQVTVVGPANNTDCFPFGCAQVAGPSTRYQQVYRASAFPGPIDIVSLTFFNPDPGIRVLNTGAFDLFLTTTSAAVDALNTSNLDANLGPTTAFFGHYTIGGLAPAQLTLTGIPFLYDPAQGNLLWDMRVTAPLPLNASVTTSTFFTARVNALGGNYSRADDFGAGFAGFGLGTRFGVAPLAAVPEPATWLLFGSGLLAVVGLTRRRRGVCARPIPALGLRHATGRLTL